MFDFETYKSYADAFHQYCGRCFLNRIGYFNVSGHGQAADHFRRVCLCGKAVFYHHDHQQSIFFYVFWVYHDDQEIYRWGHHIPIRYLVYIALTAILRQEMVTHGDATQTLILSIAIFLLVLTLIALEIVEGRVPFSKNRFKK